MSRRPACSSVQRAGRFAFGRMMWFGAASTSAVSVGSSVPLFAGVAGAETTAVWVLACNLRHTAASPKTRSGHCGGRKTRPVVRG